MVVTENCHVVDLTSAVDSVDIVLELFDVAEACVGNASVMVLSVDWVELSDSATLVVNIRTVEMVSLVKSRISEVESDTDSPLLSEADVVSEIVEGNEEDNLSTSVVSCIVVKGEDVYNC